MKKSELSNILELRALRLLNEAEAEARLRALLSSDTKVVEAPSHCQTPSTIPKTDVVGPLTARLRAMEDADERPPKPVCSTCNDTHQMQFGEREPVMCTRCPLPCQKCRKDGNGPYCTNTPCQCTCHSNSLAYHMMPNVNDTMDLKLEASDFTTPIQRARDALTKISEMVEHDSPAYCEAQESLPWLDDDRRGPRMTLGPSPDFYCSVCDIFDIATHEHPSSSTPDERAIAEIERERDELFGAAPELFQRRTSDAKDRCEEMTYGSTCDLDEGHDGMHEGPSGAARMSWSIATTKRSTEYPIREAFEGLLANIKTHHDEACSGITPRDCLDSIYEAAEIARYALFPSKKEDI